MIVSLEISSGHSVYPFSVTVTASEKSPVSAEGNWVMCMIICSLKVWLTGGVDFNTTILTATFASGMTMSNVSVPVIVDNIAEEHEEFDLMLIVPSSLGPAITAGSRDTATGVITEDISKFVIRYVYVMHDSGYYLIYACTHLKMPFVVYLYLPWQLCSS